MIELVLIKEHKKQRNNTYQKGILTHNRGTWEREPGNKKPRTPTRNCWGGKISILIRNSRKTQSPMYIHIKNNKGRSCYVTFFHICVQFQQPQ